MKARLRWLLEALGDAFWLIPALLVGSGIAGALGALRVDRSGLITDALTGSSWWLYDGGATGARTLLGAVASSTIGVAGTVFSITIAALSLAAGQMGPRLLRSFTRDRGNQVTLGIFLGTFAYALMVLRSVRTHSEGNFVPSLSLSIAMGLAVLCIATLVYFVGHMAGRINVETVIDLVSREVSGTIRRLTVDQAAPPPPDGGMWADAVPLFDNRTGYLQELDEEGLATWAAAHGVAVRLCVRPGSYLFPGAPVALITPYHSKAGAAIRDATALGRARVSASDLEFAVRQLVEVGVRALSAGINDPFTAIAVLDRLGEALCQIASRELPDGVHRCDGRVVLQVPPVDYDGLVDSMLHMMRQDAKGGAAVLMRMLEVLCAVAGVERRPERQATLRRHGRLVFADGEREIANPDDLADLRDRFETFNSILEQGPLAGLRVPSGLPDRRGLG